VILAALGVAGMLSATFAYGPGDVEPPAAAAGRLASVLEGPVVAVLPFINASEAAEGASFLASGVHGEILTHLSKLSGINAISRTSVLGYDRVGRTVRQIAADLGASAIVEGTVQRAGGTIRINVSLIDALNDTQLWGEIYDRALEPESLFAVQGDVAARIAEALAVALAPEEQSRLTQVPTTDPQALEFYLMGKEAEGRASRGDFDLYPVAYDYFADALEHDSLYAQAHAALAGLEERLYYMSATPERTTEQLERMRISAERAIELDPELSEGHLVLGKYYLTWRHDAIRAQESLLRARRFDPGNVLALRNLAVLAMKAGDWDAARSDLRRAADLDPREPQVQMSLADLSFYTRRFDETERLQRRLLNQVKLLYDGEHIRQGPGALMKIVYQQLFSTYLAADGDTDRAVEALNEMIALMNMPPEDLTFLLNDFYPRHAAPFGATFLRVPEMHEAVVSNPAFHERIWWALGAKAWVLRFSGEDPDEERRLWGVAGDRIGDNIMPELATEVENRSYVGLRYARAGRHEEARAQMARAREAAETSLGAHVGLHAEPRWAMTLVELGEHDQALDLIEDMLSRPSALSVNLLNIQPEWDAIRENPRFQALLEHHAL